MSCIGLDLGATKMNAGLVVNRKITKIVSDKTKAQDAQKKIIKQITGLLDQLIDSKVESIGIGVPGLVDKEGVTYEAVNMPDWIRVPLKTILEKKYRLPVFVSNDAKCFALGEKYFGQGKKYRNIAGITLGTGIGTGIIINGKLYYGANGGAGEFGQAQYRDGIMEHYSSAQFFQRIYKMTGDEVYGLALKGDEKALAIFKEYGYHLGKTLSLIVYAVDPQVIILGGSVVQSYNFFEKAMKESLQESSYLLTYSRLKITVSDDPNMAILGAAALCMSGNR